MVLYYWNKYKVIERYSTNPDTWPWEYEHRNSNPYSTDDSGYEYKAQSFSLDDEGKVVPNYKSYHRSNMSPGVPYYFVYNNYASMESGHREYVKFVYSTVGQYYVEYERWKCNGKNIPKSGMARGELVQSNIVARASAYVNGVNSDGFWYERGSALPTAPTTPGPFTEPSGILEIDDLKVFTVGGSFDPNYNLSKYIWEVSINGAAYSKVGETSLPNFTYKIPIATSLKMRVKAIDTTGLQSAYRESSSYTVRKRNTAPTRPGAFTQPSGILEIGDSKVFVVGASTDTDGNLSKYIWEVSINGAAYSNVGETISRSLTYKIPIATSLKMRVKAVDTDGLESAYRESSLYTVQKRNTAPTRPGAFTQPMGTLEIGDAKIFTVGASTDAENNISKYVWQVQINGGAWSASVIPDTTTPIATYVIPSATSLKIRVKAVDTEGLESDWRESNVFTVTKPVYYWIKYNAIGNKTYKDDAPWQDNGLVTLQLTRTTKAYTFDASTNKYSLSGGYWGPTERVGNGMTGYALVDGNLQRYVLTSNNSDISYAGDTLEARSTLKLPSKNTFTITSYRRGGFLQNGITAEEGTYPTDGRHTDGYWYVRGSRVNASIAPPGAFTLPTIGKNFKPNEVVSIVFGASIAPNLSLYEVDYRYNSTSTWMRLSYNNSLTRTLTVTTDKTLKTLEFRVRARDKNNVYSDYVYSDVFEIEHNVAPTVSLRQPSGTVRLYENDTLNIEGTAFDSDPDQSVTVYYQINNEPRKILATNISQERFALSKQLTFKGGKLYNGKTAITGNLSQGLQRLFVWAEDTEKGISSKIERRFSVIPNRAPMLSVDAVVPSGVVDTDTFKISGKVSDEDANATVKVTSRINANEPVEIYSGSGGAWEFDVKLAQLILGENTILLEVVDNYGAKASKTIKLNKKEVKTPILQSVARYKIEPPSGSAKGVLLFIQRDKELNIKVELSMTAKGESEQYTVLTPVNTAPIIAKQGVVEDTFEHKGIVAKQQIVLKITSTRTDLASNHKIHLITGAVD